MTRITADARRVVAGLVALLLLAVPVTLATGLPSRAAESPQLVPSEVETVPVLHSGDAMDDPAVWVPSRSRAR
jgi:myo-inositol-hexaphosphate 3-phosphohydrolase